MNKQPPSIKPWRCSKCKKKQEPSAPLSSASRRSFCALEASADSNSLRWRCSSARSRSCNILASRHVSSKELWRSQPSWNKRDSNVPKIYKRYCIGNWENQWALTIYYLLDASICNEMSKKSFSVLYQSQHHQNKKTKQPQSVTLSFTSFTFTQNFPNHQSFRHSSSWMLRAFNSSSYLVFFPTISRRRVSPSKAVSWKSAVQKKNGEHVPVSQAESKEI